MYNLQSQLLLEIYAPVMKSDFYFSYMDRHTDELTGLLTNLMLDQLSMGLDLKKSSVKRAIFLTTEAFQNIVRHQLNDAPPLERKTIQFDGFQICVQSGTIVISTMNKIKKEISVDLQSVLEELKGLSKEELKERWKNQLVDGVYTQNGGGGLGLIEMARKTDAPLDFKFWPISDTRALFRLNLILGENSEGSSTSSLSDLLDDLAFDQLSEETILAFKGNLNQQSLQNLYRFMEAYFAASEKECSDRLNFIANLLKGIEANGLNKEGEGKGYFVVGREEPKGYYFLSGYAVSKEQFNGNERAYINNLKSLNEKCTFLDSQLLDGANNQQLVNIVAVLE